MLRGSPQASYVFESTPSAIPLTTERCSSMSAAATPNFIPSFPPVSSNPAVAQPALTSAAALLAPHEFLPPEPATLEAAGLTPTDVEALVLKLLLNSGATVGRRIAEQLRLPFGLVAEQLRLQKAQMLLNYSNQAAMGDFEYDLTEEGQKRAHWHASRCTYCGAAPVPLEDYVAAVEKQSVRKLKPKLAELSQAFNELMLSPATLAQIGQAIHAGRGLFLYGQPG